MAAPAHAQTWLGTQGNLWSAGANWTGGAAPANNGTANVVFSQSSASKAVLLDANWNVASVTLNATPGMMAYTSAGLLPTLGYNSPSAVSLTVQGGGISSVGSSKVAVVPNLVAAQPQSWNIGGGGLLVSNLISGAGSITKTGAGTLTLANLQNTLTGGFSAAGGSVVTAGSGSLGADGSPVTLANGATLSFGAGSASATSNVFTHPLTLGPGGGAITTNSRVTAVFNGGVSGPGALTFATSYQFSNITESSYTLSGNNSYAGGTIIGTGVTVSASGPGPALGVGGATLQSGAALTLGAADNVGAGRMVTLQGNTADQYSSALVLNDAAIQPASLVDPASTGGVIALGSITYSTPLDFAAIGNGRLWFGAGGVSVYGAATLGAGSDGVYRFGGGTAGTLTLNGTDNVLTGARAVVVGETGVFQGYSVTTGSQGAVAFGFARANDYTGGTTLNLGTLTVGDDHALGSGPLTLNGGFLQADGGARTLPNAVILNATGSKFGIRGLNSLAFAGPVDLNGGARAMSSNGIYGVTAFANVISNGTLTLNAGSFSLTAANTLSGLTIGAQATVRVSSDANLGAAGATLTISGGTLSPQGSSLTIDRPIAVPYSQGAVATNGGIVTLNGAVTGSNALTKRDAGTLVLTSLGNTASFSVIGGTLQVDNVAGGRTGNAVPITVDYGGNLAGTGLVGYTSVGNGSISPGDHGPGTLSVGSGLVLSDGATLNFDLGTRAADALVLSSAHLFQIQGSKPVVVNLSDAGGLAPGQTYKLVDWGQATTTGVTAAAFQLGASPVNGTFSVNSGALYFITTAYTPYQQWQAAYFGSINNAAAAPTASPAGDGIANLLKYALGLDPLHPATAGLPQAGQIPGYLTLTYTKPKSVTDVVCTPQFSDDLATWSSAGIVQEVLLDDGTTQTVRAKVSASASVRRFLRLNVTAQ